MYSAYDCIHMPTVMSYIVGVMSSTYTADVIEFRTGFKLDIEPYRYRYI